jgi:hypothetical protein
MGGIVDPSSRHLMLVLQVDSQSQFPTSVLRVTFRRFPPNTEQLARVWRGQAFSEHRWLVVGSVGAGESESLIVQDDAGLRAVAKPAVDPTHGYFRGAHEKIAADLAYDAGIPVPPVVLWRNGPGTGSSKLYSLSYWGGFTQFEYWNVAADHGLLNEQICSSVARAVAAIGLFHLWISAHDRKPEHFLIDVQADPRQMGIAVVDHAFSMSSYWKRADDRDWPAPFRLEGVPDDPLGCEMAIQAINACKDATIHEICARIPLEFLPDDRRDIIVSNLAGRKLEIPQRFSNARGAIA